LGFYKGTIARQFIIRILLFSMLITTVLTGVQLYIDYTNGIKDIQKKAMLVEVSYLKSIANSMWYFDNDSLDVQLNGLFNLPDVQYLHIKSDALDVHRGEQSDQDNLSHTFPINYKFLNEAKHLGEMTIQFSFDGLYQRLLDKVIVIFVSQAIKTFLVSFFIFYIFYQLVGRYLGDITDYAKNLNETTLAKKLVLSKSSLSSKKTNLVDEIDELTFALNEMRENFLGYKKNIEESQSELEYVAMHDSLTDLPNRVLLNDRAEMMVNEAKRENHKIAFLYLDLDGFKQVNDMYGHKTGDQLLIHVAQLLKKTVRNNDTVSRLSGDEFVILLHADDDVSATAQISKKIIDVLSAPISVNGITLSISASIGVSFYPEDGENSDLLLRHADAAMYKAKEEGENNVQFYRKEFTDIVEKQLRVERELDDALEHNELEVYFQPQIDVKKHKVIGAEALVRWNSKEKGMISPAEFIPIAEKTGQITKIDQWVLNQVATFVSELNQDYIWVPKISVNFSSKEFDQLPLSEVIDTILIKTQCPSKFIEVELTESALMDDPVKCARELAQMRELGLSVAIDDFGTGYSSLSYLKFLPINKLKIDQAFVRDLQFDMNDQAIVKAIIALGQSLDMELIAEGVETEEQLAFLQQEGCFEIQGYLFSKPLPKDEFISFIKNFDKA